MRSDNPSWFGWPFARLWNRSAPNADRPVAIVGPDLSQPQPANIDVAIVPRGTGALTASIPDETIAGGNKRGTNAVDLQTSRNAATLVASGNFSFLGGGSNNQATGTQSVAVGGSSCVATNTQAAIVGGFNNQATGTQSFVGGGQTCVASNIYTVSVGGRGNTASGQYSGVLSGFENAANGDFSVVPGGAWGTSRSLYGRLSFSSGRFTVIGDAQWGLSVLRRETTNATLTVLTADAAAPAAATIPVLPDSGLYAFRIRVVCIQSAGTSGTVGDCKAWDVVGAIKRGANAASTALLGTPTITVLGADTGLGADNVTGAIISITADTTRGGINVNVTGEANKTLRWVASVETTEVDY